MKKIVNIGIIGFGTVGQGVYNLIKKNSGTIALRSGIELNIKTICDLNLSLLAGKVQEVKTTDKWEDVVNDKEIDIVVEVIGGISPAKEIIISSLNNGKNAVTANKKLLAEDGISILEAIAKTGGSIGFEAAVGGGIPCILSLRQGMIGNRIRSIVGILNGTSNYILTRMDEDSAAFAEALKDAQDKGFAEADPTFDIEGCDAGHKISLLSMLSYGKLIEFKSIPIEGISNISSIDISYAKDMGYIIKLLGIAKFKESVLDIRVHPTMIPNDHPLASVRNEFNSIMFDGDMTGAIILNGRGAGSLPTASSIVSDIIQLSNKNDYNGILSSEVKLMSSEERISRYYIRLQTEDSPGILSQISGVLGTGSISIASVIQKEVNEGFVPLIIVTHEAVESNLLKCIDDIENFPFVKERAIVIPVEDFKN
ncbi:MAG: homoserine dehydrogenase [Leptospirales bacterium]|nr:homoserine dehydrogenase [Leptospirales bacterium]